VAEGFRNLWRRSNLLLFATEAERDREFVLMSIGQ